MHNILPFHLDFWHPLNGLAVVTHTASSKITQHTTLGCCFFMPRCATTRVLCVVVICLRSSRALFVCANNTPLSPRRTVQY